MDLNNIPTELPKSIDDAIGNLTRKPTQNIGTTFADCWYLVFGGLSLKADKKKLEYQASLETFREQLENKRNTIPPEKLVEPDIQTTCTALENSKYCIDKEELRNMFVTLISNSISSDTASKCHPSFGEIIKQMNVLDAKNIALFKNIKEYPIAEYRINFKNGGYTTLLRNVFLDGDNNYSLEQHSSSISSLCRLGLLDIPMFTKINNNSLYEKFENEINYIYMKSHYNDDNFMAQLEKQSVVITPFGSSFVEVCIP